MFKTILTTTLASLGLIIGFFLYITFGVVTLMLIPQGWGYFLAPVVVCGWLIGLVCGVIIYWSTRK